MIFPGPLIAHWVRVLISSDFVVVEGSILERSPRRLGVGGH